MDLRGSNRDPANPHLVGGLDLDRKWILTGNEISRDNLICWKHTVEENVKRSTDCGRDDCIVGCMRSRGCTKLAG